MKGAPAVENNIHNVDFKGKSIDNHKAPYFTALCQASVPQKG